MSIDQQKNSSISREAWLAALGEDEIDNQAALTARELADVLGCSQQSAYHRAETLVRQGKATRTTKRVEGQRNGGRRFAAAYMLIEAPKRRGK